MCSGNIWEDPKLLLLSVLEALHKQEVKTKAELLSLWLNVEGMPQHPHRDPQQKLLPAFKEISVQSLAYHQANQVEISVIIHDKENRLYRICSEKSSNKQQ